MNQPKPLSDGERRNQERKDKIAQLNDRLRQHGEGGQILATVAVQALEDRVRSRLIQAVREFDDFNSDCDPHGVHDFGIVKLDGQSYYFKVDYYDQNLEFASPDPADNQVTKRVMTILRSDEY